MLLAYGCSSQSSSVDAGDASSDAVIDAAIDANGPAPLVISAANPVPRTTSWSVNYWQWMPDYGDGVTGTAELVKALKPAFLRVGGYNNDVNAANPFDNAAFDKAVAYARAIGAEPIVQVPVLGDTKGQTPTASTAAAMVSYANVTMGYAIKYFSIGNEPDLYATQLPGIPDYTPSDYCTTVRAYVAAMKAVDPTIQIVGPDLSWKYQAGTTNDWLTPILASCGDAFDIVSIHRYPFSATQASLTAAAADPAAFRRVIAGVRDILQTTGNVAKPLSLTEMNIVYDKTWCTLDASPGTVGSALWLADSLGTAIELGLWTSAVWDISDPDAWGLGLIGAAPGHLPRPSYYAYALFADHFGPTLVDVTSVPSGISAHASRKASGDATEVIVINWNNSAITVPVKVTGLASAPATATFVVPAQSMAAMEIPDDGPANAWVYGEAQRQTSVGPQRLAAGVEASYDASVSADGGAGRAVGTGCGVPAIPDAAYVPTTDGGIATACNVVVPEATGKLNVSGSYVTANNLHGQGGVWAWKGAPSQATICVAPSCTTSDSFGFVAIDAIGVAPLSPEPVSCSPALAPSALCAAGSISRDPTYYSTVGVGFNFNQDVASGTVHGLPIMDSVTVSTQLSGGGKGNATLRLQLTDMEGNYYCVEAGDWKSGRPTPIRNFRKQCWDSSVPNAAAAVGTVARRLDVYVGSGLSDLDFSFCLLDVTAK